MPRLPAILLTVGTALALATPAEASLGISTGTPATFASFAPGTTVTATGSVTVTSTNLTWTLTAQDTATLTPGRLDKVVGDAHCATGDQSLANPVSLQVSGASGSPGFVALGGAPQTVASGSGLLSGLALTTTYRQTIPSTQRMAAGCPYQLTTTFTLS